MIEAKIEAIKKELQSVKKTSTGYNFKYPDLTTMKESLDPLLDKYKLYVGIENIMYQDTISLSINGKDTLCGVFKVQVLIKDLEDNSVADRFIDCLADNGMKSPVQCSGSTYSYMQRYIKKVIFDLDFVDDDPDHIKNSTPSNRTKATQKDNSALKEVYELLDKYKSLKPANVAEIIEEVSGGKGKKLKDLNEEQSNKVLELIKERYSE